LRGVSFEVFPGDVLGIIGRNGAGKSTLLKVLSRVTEPTTGSAVLMGRVGSLLEVGTGFHPELTGRENVYLNGAILGMKKGEVKRKFDEIVAFAEVERFVDTPVKHYSSGMYLRLAFAVAAHLEPEILLIDEVLAVGDASFQKKCLGKMGEVGRLGRTVLFVSHNLAAVSALCSRVMILHEGALRLLTESAAEAIHTYTEYTVVASTSLEARQDRSGDGGVRIVRFETVDGRGRPVEHLVSGQEVEFRIHYRSRNGRRPSRVLAAISLNSVLGYVVSVLSNDMSGEIFDSLPPEGVLRCAIARLPIASGMLSLNLMIKESDVIQDWIQDATRITVEGGDYYGTGRVTPASHGGFLIEQRWDVSPRYALEERQ
jgi:lipopolysaccharide transport system ATP-binding protein